MEIVVSVFAVLGVALSAINAFWLFFRDREHVKVKPYPRFFQYGDELVPCIAVTVTNMSYFDITITQVAVGTKVFLKVKNGFVDRNAANNLPARICARSCQTFYACVALNVEVGEMASIDSVFVKTACGLKAWATYCPTDFVDYYERGRWLVSTWGTLKTCSSQGTSSPLIVYEFEIRLSMRSQTSSHESVSDGLISGTIPIMS